MTDRTTTDKLNAALYVLAQHRAKLEATRANVERALEELEKTSPYRIFKALEQQAKETEAQVKKVEAYVRDLIVNVYEETGNKKPVSGASVRLISRPVYDESVVFAWCVKNQPAFLTLDKRRWEKDGETVAPDLIHFVKEPQTLISRSLADVVDLEVDEELVGQVLGDLEQMLENDSH